MNKWDYIKLKFPQSEETDKSKEISHGMGKDSYMTGSSKLCLTCLKRGLYTRETMQR